MRAVRSSVRGAAATAGAGAGRRAAQPVASTSAATAITSRWPAMMGMEYCRRGSAMQWRKRPCVPAAPWAGLSLCAMKLLRHAALVAVVVALPLIWNTGPAAQGPAGGVPIFEYDPTFPKPMRENWAIGAIGG